ncbi:hypothetical protein JQX13_00450 [Archangium violaceum]|uniref:hypothetical protein n=1 Tax=Archangium violaceum TaxID=83451 RepID=UPI00193C2842|nr:hypothetical protein [Archangium violaceum]QRK08696.1 hypothetical protein JQX13_00450 [Archangium violaceum]
MPRWYRAPPVDTVDVKPSSSLPVPPRGLGTLFFLALLWLLPGALAGVFRAALGLPLWVGALVGVAGVAGLTWKVVSRERPWPTHVPLAILQALYVATALGLTWRMLGIPAMEGLVSVGGGDAGNHVALRADFVSHEPHVYQGFILFHTVTYGLEWLFGLDAFTSFRAGFYLVPAVIAVALAAGVESVAGRLWRSGRAQVAAQVVLLVATAAAWPFLLLRLLHYHQADGFYGHLFGLVPLVLAWLAYGLPRSVWVRCGALAVFTVFYRFTYGLNLGDFLFTCGVLVLVEGTRSFGPRYRWGAWLVGLGLLGAAAYAYWRLLPLASLVGGIRIHSHVRALRVQWWTLAGLLAVRFLSPREDSVERRLLDFALLFCGVNALVQFAYKKAGLPLEYYFLKYGLHGVVLLLCVALFVTSIRMGAVFQKGLARAWRWELALAVLAAIGLFEVTREWGRAYEVYEPSYWERVRGEPPFQTMEALEDRGATAIIRRVLRDEGKRFGGLLTPSWPRSNFSNVALGWVPDDWSASGGHWPLFSQGQVREGPGLCVFWEASATDWEGYQRVSDDNHTPLADVVRKLQARPDKVCRDYAAPWVSSGSRTLCYRCD